MTVPVTAPIPGPRRGRPAEPGPRPRWRRPGPGAVPYLLAAAFFTAYAALSLLRHRRWETHAYDLGLFEQVVRNYAHLRAPVSDIREPGFNVLGEHFHPILALLGPVYRVFPSPQTLLVAQALLLAVSVIPMTRIGRRAFGDLGGAAFGVAYGLSWGIQSAVAFDFHEICFAVPMIAFALDRYLRGDERGAVLWLIPIVFVKEDLGLTLVTFGLLLAARRRWGTAAVAIVVGAVAFALTVFVILPSFNPHGTYPFWGNLDGEERRGNAEAGAALSEVPFWQLLYEMPKRMLLPSEKWMTLFTLLVPTGFLALRSPLIALVVPTLLWRFSSGNQFYWGVHFHYSAVLMPVVLAAFADAVVKLRASRRDWLRRYAAKAAIVPLAATLALSRDFPLMDLAHLRTYRVPDRVQAAERVVRLVPDDAQVSATESAAPRLTSRTEVTDFPVVRPGPGWIVAETWGAKREWVLAWVTYYEGLGFERVAREGGVIVLRR